eukprot:scaffold187383_cov22-Tisochrysis_lutea.AAC.1
MPPKCLCRPPKKRRPRQVRVQPQPKGERLSGRPLLHPPPLWKAGLEKKEARTQPKAVGMSASGRGRGASARSGSLTRHNATVGGAGAGEALARVPCEACPPTGGGGSIAGGAPFKERSTAKE